MNNTELSEKIDFLIRNYQGDGEKLCTLVGMLVVGELYGWKVVRLVCPKRIWQLSKKNNIDPKQFLPEVGLLAHRSLGFRIAQKAGQYWDYVKGETKAMPLTDRKEFSS